MKQLQTLNISKNKFQQLPSVIYELTSLKTLKLLENGTLEKIEQDILELPDLSTLDCDKCTSLTSPPYAVCKQGLTAVRKYFTDLNAEKGISATEIPISLLGVKLGAS